MGLSDSVEQERQTELPTTDVYLPATHPEQLAAPLFENVPAAQRSHKTLPTPAANDPATH